MLVNLYSILSLLRWPTILGKPEIDIFRKFLAISFFSLVKVLVSNLFVGHFSDMILLLKQFLGLEESIFEMSKTFDIGIDIWILISKKCEILFFKKEFKICYKTLG